MLLNHLGAKVRKLVDVFDYISMQDDWGVLAVVHYRVFSFLCADLGFKHSSRGC